MTARAGTGFALLVLLGFLGNYFSIPLFFGADFLLGSVAVLVALSCFGLGWGLAAALVVHSYTLLLWGHPYGLVAFLLEALFVGIMLRRGRGNLLVLDSLFWLLAGVPLNWLFYAGILHMDTTTTLFVILKQGINGVFNALLASLAINYLPLSALLGRSRAERTYCLKDTSFILLVTIFLVPGLLFTSIEIKDEMGQIEHDVTSRLQTLSVNLNTHLSFWHRDKTDVLKGLAARAEGGTPSDRLQHDVDLLRNSNPEFLTLHVEDASGTTVSCSPRANFNGSTIGVSLAQREWFQQAKATRKPVMSNVFTARSVTLGPTVVMSLPLDRGGDFAGTVAAAIDLRQVTELLRSYGRGTEMVITLSDARGRVIASTAANRTALQSWDVRKGGVVTQFNASVLRWSPAGTKLPSMTRWNRSFFVQQSRCGENLPWTLTLESPLAPHQQHLYAIYVRDLSIMAALCLIALVLAILLSNLIAKPVESLARTTTDLPEKILDGGTTLAWPRSRITELAALIGNFSYMARTLQQYFHSLREGERRLALTNQQMAQEIEERKQTELLLRQSEEQFRSIVESSPAGMLFYSLDPDDRLVLTGANPAAERILGKSHQPLVGMSLLEAFPGLVETTVPELYRKVAKGELGPQSFEITHDDGRIVGTFEVTAYRSGPGSIAVDFVDITARKGIEEERSSLERQLLHAQKLESLGVLAGGIAHDFNNILMAILGNADLALMRINRDSPAVEHLVCIEQSATRAADLAKQMLAYSGKGRFKVECVDLDVVLEEMLSMLQVSISKKALLQLNLDRALPGIEVDVTQLRQVVMNLVINASEALDDGSGVISVATGCKSYGPEELKDFWLDENLAPGRYVMLQVRDTGCGMDGDTLTKIFDPFFTTKFTGRGLGMAAVLGIVRGHNGAIRVLSEPGQGTTFTILLPVSGRPTAKPGAERRHDAWRGSGTVLLVDDEEAVRRVGRDMLQELGFSVVTANDGREAVDVFGANPAIDLVILDLTMPHMDGEQCYHRLRALRPGVKVFLSSGFSKHEVTRKFGSLGLAGFIIKPYSLATLRSTLQQCA